MTGSPAWRPTYRPAPAIANAPSWVLILALPDLVVAVVERECTRGVGRLLAFLLEGCGEDQVLAGRHVLGADDHLLGDADEAVDVVQPVVLDVQGVAAEARADREQHALGAGRGRSTSAPITNERLRVLTACHSATGASPGK